MAAMQAQIKRSWFADNILGEYYNDIQWKEYEERQTFLEKFESYEEQLGEQDLVAMMNILRVFNTIDVVVADDLLIQISNVLPTWMSTLKAAISTFQAQEHVHAHEYEKMFNVFASKYPLELQDDRLETDPQMEGDLFGFHKVEATPLFDAIAKLYQHDCSNPLQLAIRQTVIEFVLLPIMLTRLDAVFKLAPHATGQTFAITNREIAVDEKVHGSTFAFLSNVLRRVYEIDEEWLEQLYSQVRTCIHETVFGFERLEKIGNQLLDKYNQVFRRDDVKLQDFDTMLSGALHGLYGDHNIIAIQSTGRGLYNINTKESKVVVKLINSKK